MSAIQVILSLVLTSVAWVPSYSADSSRALPCEATQLSVAADGSGVWFACSQLIAKQRQMIAQNDNPPPYAGTSNDPTDVYWLAISSDAPVKIASAQAVIYVMPAPRQSQALLIMPQEHGWGKAILYQQERRIRALPVDAYSLLWSYDASKLYFYGGTTIQADAWNILGVYDMHSTTIHRRRLRQPTEAIRICPATGNVYSIIPGNDANSSVTVEYDSDIHYIKQIRKWVGGEFSAACKYVASAEGAHGPLPWRIYDTATEHELFAFDAIDEEGKKQSYSFAGWNPKHESVILREHYFGEGVASTLEVFDVKTGTVLQLLPDFDLVRWSADGDSLLAVDANELKQYQVFPGKSE